MTVTVEQVQAGLIKYIDSEIAPKATTAAKFMIYFVTPSIVKGVVAKINDIKKSNLMPDLFDESGNIVIDEVYARAKEAMKKTGKLYIDGLNYFADEVDLERLYNLIKTA